jgi:hypothetical protein
VVEMLEVINVVPAKAVPPVETLYQLIVPAEAVLKLQFQKCKLNLLVVAVIVGDGFSSNSCSGAFGHFHL